VNGSGHRVILAPSGRNRRHGGTPRRPRTGWPCSRPCARRLPRATSTSCGGRSGLRPGGDGGRGHRAHRGAPRGARPRTEAHSAERVPRAALGHARGHARPRDPARAGRLVLPLAPRAPTSRRAGPARRGSGSVRGRRLHAAGGDAVEAPGSAGISKSEVSGSAPPPTSRSRCGPSATVADPCPRPHRAWPPRRPPRHQRRPPGAAEGRPGPAPRRCLSELIGSTTPGTPRASCRARPGAWSPPRSGRSSRSPTSARRRSGRAWSSRASGRGSPRSRTCSPTPSPTSWPTSRSRQPSPPVSERPAGG